MRDKLPTRPYDRTHGIHMDALLIAGLALFFSANALADCLDRVVVRPIGLVTTNDSVSLEIEIWTSSTPTQLVEPTEVQVNGNQILVDIYADGGPVEPIGHLHETVELGPLPAGTYTYQIVQHPTEYCTEQTLDGSFCVQDAACADEMCACPEPVRPQYTILDIGMLDSLSASGWAINERGQVVGGSSHAYLWDAGIMTDLGTLGGALSMGRGINNHCQVVGDSGLPPGEPGGAFLWEDGVMTNLGSLDGEGSSGAYGVNDQGQVTGYSATGSGAYYHAFLWEDGVMTDLGTLGGAYSIGWGINNHCQVVGGSWLRPGETGGAFLWEDGVMTNLGSLGGDSAARGLNDVGQVVGWSYRAQGDLTYHACLWDAGQAIDLGVLGGYAVSAALGINNHGHAVGWGYREAMDKPFIYDQTRGLRDLRDLVIPDNGWHLLSPCDINDAGQIIGQGYHASRDSRAFLMTPIDADFDDDGDTDMADLALFQRCFSGPDAPIAAGCQAVDIDRNGRIDLDDFLAFHSVFTSP